ncbi:cytochrome c [Chelativorans sp. AA-79]|uniref:SorU family sulfite dehydrogenase c-type cytochrome subunit n=1 Tax=Chelativorans sp. AA-79 TaxID=3028735 RepID=UPI0023F6438C|nr:cytochrome c [Chelativorans sp. AA-79]WEX11695.1 cytochrome c [Chelativorans sp. AA-79]
MPLAAVALIWAAGAAAQDDASAPPGRQVFQSAEPACAICHILEDAGAKGRVGPSLDSLQPSAEQVRSAVREGPGTMPSYADRLSQDQIDALAEYVAGAAGQ